MGWAAQEWFRSRGDRSVRRRVHVGFEAVGYRNGSDLHRVPPKVWVARGRPHLRGTEQFPDHWQDLPECERPRGGAVSQVMQADVFKPGFLANDLPRSVQRPQAGTAHVAGKHGGVVGPARQRGPDLSPWARGAPPARRFSHLAGAAHRVRGPRVTILASRFRCAGSRSASGGAAPRPRSSRPCPWLRGRRGRGPAGRTPSPTGSAGPVVYRRVVVLAAQIVAVRIRAAAGEPRYHDGADPGAVIFEASLDRCRARRPATSRLPALVRIRGRVESAGRAELS